MSVKLLGIAHEYVPACTFKYNKLWFVCFFESYTFFSEGLEQECTNTDTNMFHISEAFMSLLLKLLEHKLKVYSLNHQRLIKEVYDFLKKKCTNSLFYGLCLSVLL